MFEASFIDELFSIPWFKKCGETIHGLPFSASQVFSWQSAIEHSAGITWENTTLEARNDLTFFLHQKYLDQYQDWNYITTEVKERIIRPLSEGLWEPFATQKGFDRTFINSVQWDILAVCMEHAFRSSYGLPKFFHELLKVYKAGHFPCGWSGEYPNGSLYFW